MAGRLFGRSPRVHLVLFGALCTLYDVVAAGIDSDHLYFVLLAESAFLKVFVNAALLACIYFNVRWAMILFCALAVGYVSVLLVMLPWGNFLDLSVSPVERLGPDLAVFMILALYAVMAAFLVLLTQRALKASGK